MTILKTNDLAKEFSTKQSFTSISYLLDNDCLSSHQVSYNVLCMLWILSYHEFTHEYYEDYTMSIIEKVTKVMDYHSKEKIARIMLMLFDNLKDIPDCQDHLSEIDALNLIVKLQNRHWVDEDINKMLEDLYGYFEENQKVYSSIEKFKKQVERKQLRWGPCHQEKFW
jgi:V-type H+-transporting ATPase subunit H